MLPTCERETKKVKKKKYREKNLPDEDYNEKIISA